MEVREWVMAAAGGQLRGLASGVGEIGVAQGTVVDVGRTKGERLMADCCQSLSPEQVRSALTSGGTHDTSFLYGQVMACGLKGRRVRPNCCALHRQALLGSQNQIKPTMTMPRDHPFDLLVAACVSA